MNVVWFHYFLLYLCKKILVSNICHCNETLKMVLSTCLNSLLTSAVLQTFPYENLACLLWFHYFALFFKFSFKIKSHFTVFIR